MKLQGVTVILLTASMVASESFLIPELDNKTNDVMKRKSQNSDRQYQRELNELAARQPVENNEESEDEESQDNESADVDNSEPEEGGGSGTGRRNNQEDQRAYGKEKEEPRAGKWMKLRRRMFNSAMGMGIDAPMSQPQTNAYDVHNTQQSAPWQSSNNANDDLYYYYYYDDGFDPDVPLPKQKSQRQSLKPNVGRILTALLKRDRQIPRRSYRIPDNQQNADKRQQKNDVAKKTFPIGQPRSFAQWKKVLN